VHCRFADEQRMIRFVEVESEEHFEHIRVLFREYERLLGFNLDFQNFESEFAKLPGEYVLPDGCLLLVLYGDNIAGCVALRKLGQGICEMKRMYVRPNFRGKGIGRAMSVRIIEIARAIGYKRMRLDTIDTMRTAISLYKSLGFKKIEPYRHNPIKGASYMELFLVK